tara:strand:+ start:322 stop:861 length:540 start_codon:yes stop_codon:yes gene_type:complete
MPCRIEDLFDSPEERWFYAWCTEAKAQGSVKSFTYHPPSITLSEKVTVKVEKQLKTKVKTIDKFLLHPHTYTPDFILEFSKHFEDAFKDKLRLNYDGLCYIDVKPKFAGQHNNSAVTFPITRKWLWDKHKIFVNIAVPETWFKHTFVPVVVAKGIRKDRLKKWQDYKLLKEYQNGRFPG